MTIWATSARVAVPLGSRIPLPLPLMIPFMTIQCMASSAHGDTWSASVKSSRNIQLPVKPCPWVWI